MTRLPVPQQTRSRQTRERILAATERLLRRALFEELTVDAIVARARTSKGSFYNLFPDKTALLPALFDRHIAVTLRDVDAFLAHSRWRRRPLSHQLRALVERIVALHREQRGLLRALVLRGHQRSSRFSRSAAGPLAPVIPRIAARLAERAGEMRHPRPAVALRLGLLMVLATVREQRLYPQTTAHVVLLSDPALVRELTRALCGYLGVKPPKERQR